MARVTAVVRAEAMKARTKQFAVRVVRMFQALPKREDARVIGRQVVRSGTSIGANYRAVCRARSRKEFASKLGLVVEEADETVFWLELLVEAGIVTETKLNALLGEANELLAIFAAGLRTVRNGPRSTNGPMPR